MPHGMRTNVFLQACLLKGDDTWPRNIAQNLLRMNVRSVLISQNLWMNIHIPEYKNIIDAIRAEGFELGAHIQPGGWPERAGFSTKPWDAEKEELIDTLYMIKVKELGLFSYVYCDGAEVYNKPSPVAYGEESRQRVRSYCEPWKAMTLAENPLTCFYSSAVWEVFDLLGSVGSTDQVMAMDALKWAKTRAADLAGCNRAIRPPKRIELGWWGERDGTSTSPMPLYPPHYYSGVWDLAIEHKLSITYRVNIDRLAMTAPEYLRVNDLIGEMETHRSKVDGSY